ncbi:DNA-binding Lrp family transcriptional regulator [Bradyrhizobium yuanmingense]
MRYDRVNAHILEIVRKNNRLTSEVLGEMAGLPATALSTTTEEAPL